MINDIVSDNLALKFLGACRESMVELHDHHLGSNLCAQKVFIHWRAEMSMFITWMDGKLDVGNKADLTSIKNVMCENTGDVLLAVAMSMFESIPMPVLDIMVDDLAHYSLIAVLYGVFRTETTRDCEACTRNDPDNKMTQEDIKEMHAILSPEITANECNWGTSQHKFEEN